MSEAAASLDDASLWEALEGLNQEIGNGPGNARQRKRWTELEREWARRGLGVFRRTRTPSSRPARSGT